MGELYRMSVKPITEHERQTRTTGKWAKSEIRRCLTTLQLPLSDSVIGKITLHSAGGGMLLARGRPPSNATAATRWRRWGLISRSPRAVLEGGAVGREPVDEASRASPSEAARASRSLRRSARLPLRELSGSELAAAALVAVLAAHEMARVRQTKASSAGERPSRRLRRRVGESRLAASEQANMFPQRSTFIISEGNRGTEKKRKDSVTAAEEKQQRRAE